MSVAFVICEYNPFHHGHAYQFSLIREMLGEDTQIVSLMSGSTVQRGEVAVADKYRRAAAAVCCGADLVLELPYPYCSSVAEQFALGAVSILNDLCIGDYLVFGSENGDIASLQNHAVRRDSKEFNEQLLSMRSRNKDLSYPQLVEHCYKTLYDAAFPKGPNAILGVFYLSSLMSLQSSVTPITHLRLANASATAAREQMKEGSLESLPKQAQPFFSDPPSTLQKGERAILHALVGCSDSVLAEAAFGSASLLQLVQFLSGKNKTTARIRRDILHGVTGYKEENFELPKFTTVLAMNQKGSALLRKAKKVSRIPIITKPADYKAIPEIKAQFELNLRADALFALCCEEMRPANWSLRKTPFVKK